MPALIFDCDGVLADTERDGHLPAFNLAFAEFGLPITWTDAVYAQKLRIGGGKERIASAITHEILANAGLSQYPEDHALLIKNLHARKTELFTERVEAGLLPGRPGIHRLVAEALAAGWTVAIASTSAEKSVRAVLRHVVGPDSYARCHVFAGDIVAHKKPAPDIYLKVLADLRLDAGECLVVEDSGIGVEAAVGAGLTVLVTVSTYTHSDDFSQAAVVLPNLGDPGHPFTGAPLRKPPELAQQGYVALSDIAHLINR
ncbi:MAG: HAD-IA family hydrolase [Propionibacteriaceae bacterium]